MVVAVFAAWAWGWALAQEAALARVQADQVQAAQQVLLVALLVRLALHCPAFRLVWPEELARVFVRSYLSAPGRWRPRQKLIEVAKSPLPLGALLVVLLEEWSVRCH